MSGNRQFTQIEAHSLPDELVERVSRLIGAYSTVLVRLYKEDDELKHWPVGTGTFVKIGDVRGIITASHVADRFEIADSLGLTLIQGAQSNEIRWQFINRIDVDEWIEENYGPDLCFLALPDIDAKEIATYKSFAILEGLERGPYTEEERKDAYFLFGLVGERLTFEEPDAGFVELHQYQILSTLSYVEKTFESGKYDFSEVLVDSFRAGAPRSYQGTSGGGLWRVPLLVDETGMPSPKDYRLVGTAFLQTEQIGGQRRIRCHGPKSLELLVSKVKATVKNPTLGQIQSFRLR